MFRRRLRLPSPAIVIAMIALLVALGGTAVAATAGKHVDVKADTKLIKKLAPTLTVKNSMHLGGVAASGYQSKIRWALVGADGTILAQSGGISLASHSFAGGYYLNWGAPLTNTAVMSSLSEIGGFGESTASSICGGGTQGVTCVFGPNDASETFTFTTSDHNTEADHAFYIASIG